MTRHGAADAKSRLEALLPGRVATGEDVRRQHANTLTWIACEPPDAVVWPETAAEVAAILRIAREHKVPVIAFGGGTSLEGHVNAPLGGISLDMSRMNRILAVNVDDLDAEVQAGVTRDQLKAHLRDSGLFFSVDPGAGSATLGGMAATRASGTNTVRYGTMRDNILSLSAVLAGGSLIDTGRRARKSAAGYDLTSLLVGSEGTLGIITALRLRLHPVPASIVAAIAAFPTVDGACQATIEAIQSGLGLARIELLDALQMQAVNRYSGLALAETPTLFLEAHGSPPATAESVRAFATIAAGHGGGPVETAADEDGHRKLWRARHDAFWAVTRAWPGRTPLVTDVCVPLSSLARCIAGTQADIAAAGLIGPVVGHVGDGNFHVILMVDQNDAGEFAAARTVVERLTHRALAFEGTCTGEHGIGQGKTLALATEHGPALALMRDIKKALDPDGILNPGKLF